MQVEIKRPFLQKPWSPLSILSGLLLRVLRSDVVSETLNIRIINLSDMAVPTSLQLFHKDAASGGEAGNPKNGHQTEPFNISPGVQYPPVKE